MWSAEKPSGSCAVLMQSECRDGVPLRGGMRLGPRVFSPKSSPAAKKMVYLTTGGTPGGGGRGRGAQIVGVLICLSLVMGGTQSLRTEVPEKGRSYSSADECKKCTQIIPVDRDEGHSAYQAPE